MATISFKVKDELNDLLEQFCRKEERTKTHFLNKALESYLEDLYFYQKGIEILENFENSGKKAIPLEKVAEELGVKLKHYKPNK